MVGPEIVAERVAFFQDGARLVRAGEDRLELCLGNGELLPLRGLILGDAELGEGLRRGRVVRTLLGEAATCAGGRTVSPGRHGSTRKIHFLPPSFPQPRTVTLPASLSI